MLGEARMTYDKCRGPHSRLMTQTFNCHMHSDRNKTAHHLLWLTYLHNKHSALQSLIVCLTLSGSFCWISWLLVQHCSSCIHCYQLQTKRYACSRMNCITSALCGLDVQLHRKRRSCCQRSCLMHFKLLDRLATVVFIGSAASQLLLFQMRTLEGPV